MKTLESSHTRNIKELIAHVVGECTPVDPETAFAESLDESGEVDVCGLTFMPSQIWKEMDPTAFRCGVNDYADGEPWTEVEGETYADSDIETARAGFIDGLKYELFDLETHRERCAKDGEVEQDELDSIDKEIVSLEKFIAECESYSF